MNGLNVPRGTWLAPVRALFERLDAMVDRVLPGLDRSLWALALLIGFFGALVIKESPLPRFVIPAGLAAGLVTLVVASRRKPELLLYVLVAYLPFSRMLVGDVWGRIPALNLTNILLLWTAGAYAVRRLVAREPLIQRAPLDKWMLLFFGLSAFALAWAGWAYGSWYLWEHAASMKQWLTPLALYVLTFWMVRDARTLKTVLVIALGAVTMVALMALWEYVDRGGGGFGRSRVRSIAGDPNVLGAFFVYYMGLFLAGFLTFPRTRRAWLLLAPFLLCARGIMVTFSRGAYLGSAAAVLTACWFRSKRLFVAALAVCLFALVHPSILPAGLRYRLNMTVSTPHAQASGGGAVHQLDPSAQHRLELWKASLRMIQEYPWWGIGYGAFLSFLPHYTQSRVNFLDTHNVYLSIAAEMGLPTLFAFLLLLAAIGFYARRLYRRAQDPVMRAMALGLLAGLAGLMVVNIFNPCLDEQEVAGYFWILCALLMRAVLLEKNLQAEARSWKLEAGSPRQNVPTSNFQPPTSSLQHPLRVVYIIDDLGWGGAQRQLVELVKALPKDRYAPHVISLSTEKTAHVSSLRAAGIPLTLIPQHGKWSWRAFRTLQQTLRQLQPSMVHTWLFTADLYGRLAAWLARVPVIISAVRSVEPDKRRHYVAIDRLLRRATTAFTVNAAAVAEVLRARESVRPEQIHTIYNGVDLDAFDPALADGAVRSRLGLDRRVPLVGIVGRLAPVKDHATFLRAAAEVLRAVPDTHFLVVGDGPLKGSLQELARALNLRGRLHFLETQPQVADAFAALDLVVVSSRYEGCCNVILEGMAMGKPVIATAVGGNPELVLDGQTGLLVPAEQPDRLAEAIVRLLHDPALRAAMGQAARRRVEERFSMAGMVQATGRLYQSLRQERRSHG